MPDGVIERLQPRHRHFSSNLWPCVAERETRFPKFAVTAPAGAVFRRTMHGFSSSSPPASSMLISS